MKRAVLLLLVILFMVKANAQAEPANYVTAVAKFKQFYNNNQPDSIFNMFSPEMKSALPLATFKPTTGQLKAQYGDLLKTEFVKYGDALAVYKATFKNNVVLLNVSLNAGGRFTRLTVEPLPGDCCCKGTG